MQTRDYDDYIYVASTLGFRNVDDEGKTINLSQETDGYCNMYADHISVSYLHSMNDSQLNAIHFFEDNHVGIFLNIIIFLQKTYAKPELELGFRHVNILNKATDNVCYTEYVFINRHQEKIVLTLHKDSIVENP